MVSVRITQRISHLLNAPFSAPNGAHSNPVSGFARLELHPYRKLGPMSGPALFAARGVSQRGGASRRGRRSAAKGPGERSRPRPAESLADALAGPEQAKPTCWSGRPGSNRRPPAPKAGTLPLRYAPREGNYPTRAREPAVPGRFRTSWRVSGICSGEVATMNQGISRAVERVVNPQPVVEGAGVHLVRSIGTRELDHFDPFLLLDHFETTVPSDYQAGFPYHPHRGIETVTIVRQGQVRHGDSLGHAGTIGAGDIQWMTSGSGILHEEMPQVRPEGIGGLQIWLNLPAQDKMTRPKYRDLRADDLPEYETEEGAKVRVIAGEAQGGRIVGPVEGLAVAPKFVDVTLAPGASFREP